MGTVQIQSQSWLKITSHAWTGLPRTHYLCSPIYWGCLSCEYACDYRDIDQKLAMHGLAYLELNIYVHLTTGLSCGVHVTIM